MKTAVSQAADSEKVADAEDGNSTTPREDSSPAPLAWLSQLPGTLCECKCSPSCQYSTFRSLTPVHTLLPVFFLSLCPAAPWLFPLSFHAPLSRDSRNKQDASAREEM